MPITVTLGIAASFDAPLSIAYKGGKVDVIPYTLS
jgi:hypothetical protein